MMIWYDDVIWYNGMIWWYEIWYDDMRYDMMISDMIWWYDIMRIRYDMI